MRNALVLSTTIAPALTALAANSLLIDPPAEKNAICTSLKLSCVSSSTVYGLPLNVTVLPALRALASRRRFLIGKFRSARTFKNSCPTAPVAPTIATFTAAADMTTAPSRFHKRNRPQTYPGSIADNSTRTDAANDGSEAVASLRRRRRRVRSRHHDHARPGLWP